MARQSGVRDLPAGEGTTFVSRDRFAYSTNAVLPESQSGEREWTIFILSECGMMAL